jgi:2-hydroxychromene-2-carboxylate isomerase
MINIDYYMSHGSPWTFLGHKRLMGIAQNFDVKLNIYPVNYGDIFPISGGLPVSKRPPQRQKIRLQELVRWSEYLKIKLVPQPKFFPSKSLLPSLVIVASKIKNTKKEFILANDIMNALWVEELDIDNEKTLFKIITKTGLDADEIMTFAKTSDCNITFENYTSKAIKNHVFGAPTFIIEDQVYWGQDRLDFVERHLNQLSNSQ